MEDEEKVLEAPVAAFWVRNDSGVVQSLRNVQIPTGLAPVFDANVRGTIEAGHVPGVVILPAPDEEITVESIGPIEELGDLAEIDGMNEKLAVLLLGAGFDTAEKIREAGQAGLVAIDGIGKKTAEKLMAAVATE